MSRRPYPSPFTPSHRHHKGELFEVLFLANMEGRAVVVYRDVDGNVFARNRVDFYTTISPGGPPRFERIGGGAKLVTRAKVKRRLRDMGVLP